MRAFKKLMAATIATAMAATMATSAFAAELNSNGKMVLSESESYTAAGQTTVLVVPAENWVQADDQTWSITSLDDTDILYIDQWEDANSAQTAIAAGLGVKLTEGELAEGTYYVLLGGNTGVDNAFEIKAYACTISNEPEAPVIAWGDVDGNNIIDNTDAVTLFRHTTGTEALSYSNDELMRICNVDGNSEVNNTDAVTLFRHTTGTEAISGMGIGALE